MGTSKYLIALVFGGFFLQTSASLPFGDLMDLPDEILNGVKEVPKEEYRLPHDFKVLSYGLTIKPYFEGDKNFTFEGSVTIVVEPVNDNVKAIVMHTQDLKIDENTLTINNSQNVIMINKPIMYDIVHSFLILNLSTPLTKGTQYSINIPLYTGPIRNDMSGFYRSHYIENGKQKWLGTTQMQPTHARKVFPCFDEPKYKAVFNLAIIRPMDYKPTLSNMPIKQTDEINGSIKEEFHPTPSMSTYLLAFIVSEFVAAETTAEGAQESFAVWARPEAAKQGAYAFDVGPKLVKKMDEYTGVEYYKMSPNMKMDQAAIPDFSAGAMENWGLLIYREAYLMYDNSESSVRYRQQVNAILAHEIAHMWFGDYVTCHWWSDTWLNEGFARFFQYKLPDMVEPMEMETQFPVLQLQTSLLADTSVHAAPLTNPNVNTPAEISGHFGTISYNKGASILRMLMNWIKEENFKKAINQYLTTNKLDIVTPEKLFNALHDQVSTDASIMNKDKVKEMMTSWTINSGYPLLTVNINYDTGDMEITQTRFVKDGEKNMDTLYMIPLTYATKSKANFDDMTVTDMLSTKTTKINKGQGGREWVVFNKKQTGYYRVNYDANSWQMLESALKGDDRSKIHQLNRAQIVDDLFNLARENVIHYHTTFNVTRFLRNETDYAPWTAAISGFSFLRQQFNHMPQVMEKLDSYILLLMNNVTAKLGTSVKDTDSHLTKLFRMNTMNFACKLGHEGCHNESIRLFDNMVNKNEPINANIREFVYCTALRQKAEYFDKLWEKYTKENVINEKVVILGALGCTNSSEKLEVLLKQTINPESGVREQDIMTAYNSAINGNERNIDVVFEFIQSNTAEMQKHYKNNFQIAIGNIVSLMKGSQLQKFRAFLSAQRDQLSSSEYSAGISALANVALNREWVTLRQEEIEGWLDNYANGAGVLSESFGLILTIIIALLSNN